MRMNDEDFKEIIDDIKNNKIRELDLLDYYGEDITQDRIKDISVALKSNTSVKDIQFPGMGATISSPAAKSFAEMLMVNATIKRIFLHFVNMSNEAASYLEDSLKTNMTLRILSLPSNIDKSILRSIQTAIDKNNNLHPKYALNPSVFFEYLSNGAKGKVPENLFFKINNKSL